MSVLNQMLRDLEKRGVTPALVAAAGTATVARPVLPVSQRPASRTRVWIWLAVLAVGAAFVGMHTWLSYRVQEAGTAHAPLGARQFGSVVAPPSGAVPAAPAPIFPAPAPVVPPIAATAAPATPVAAAPKVAAAVPRNTTAHSQRPAPAAAPAVAATPPEPVASENVAPVVRATSEVARDVDRAADLIARGRASEAMELLIQVLARQPAHGPARSSLAALLAETGRREAALHVLLSGSEIDAGRFALPAAQLQAEMGDLDGALQTLARVPPARRTPAFEALRAGVAQRAGDHMTAIAAYKRALASPEPDPVWWVGLGVSLEATGDPGAARSAYARAAAEPRLAAEVRRYVADRLAVLDAQAQRVEVPRRGALANVF